MKKASARDPKTLLNIRNYVCFGAKLKKTWKRNLYWLAVWWCFSLSDLDTHGSFLSSHYRVFISLTGCHELMYSYTSQIGLSRRAWSTGPFVWCPSSQVCIVRLFFQGVSFVSLSFFHAHMAHGRMDIKHESRGKLEWGDLDHNIPYLASQL